MNKSHFFLASGCLSQNYFQHPDSLPENLRERAELHLKTCALCREAAMGFNNLSAEERKGVFNTISDLKRPVHKKSQLTPTRMRYAASLLILLLLPALLWFTVINPIIQNRVLIKQIKSERLVLSDELDIPVESIDFTANRTDVLQLTNTLTINQLIAFTTIPPIPWPLKTPPSSGIGIPESSI